ncbi:Blue-light-activated protein [Adhaeretor mobilis]|uniref:histidine kinase n=2 Tax=Adhaeretor mobilis TaxID=1930276 RepID=A0A517MXW4_9BACT|nr:Blue-light-activated protein [Adhaeretor mobilis]
MSIAVISLQADFAGGEVAQGEIKTLSPVDITGIRADSPAMGQQVRCSGIISWVDPFESQCVIARKGETQGVLVQLADKQAHQRLNVGDKVDVVGELSLRQSHGILQGASHLRYGSSELPSPEVVPHKIDLDRVTELEGRLLSVEGNVAHVVQYFDRYVLWIDGYDLPVRAEFRDAEKETDGLSFAGARVRITGVALQREKSAGVLRKLMLCVNSASEVEILKPSPNWPPDSKASRINGIVVCKKSPNRYFLRADTREILDLEVYDTQYVHVGDMVRFVGTEVMSRDGRKTMVAGLEVHSTSKDWVHTGEKAEAKRLSEQHVAGDWVLVRGRTSENLQEQLREGWFGVVDDHSETVRVDIDSLVGDLNTLQLETAREVEIVGYLDFDSQGASIFPADFREIKVLERQAWYQSAAARGIGMGALTVLALSLAAVFALRRAVKRRTLDLEESTGLLNASYNAVLEGICLIDDAQHIRRANPRFWELLGLDSNVDNRLSGGLLRDQLAKCFEESEEFVELWDRLAGTDEIGSNKSFHRISGEAELLNVYSVAANKAKSGKSLGRVWVFHDLTQRHRLEQTLLQSQKMEAVGRLAGGVAHDFNNMLTGISGNVALTKRKVSERSWDVSDYLEAAEQGLSRAAVLVKELLGFSRQSTMQVKSGSANDVIATLLGLVERTLDPKIKLETELHSQLHLAQFDPIKLEQVLLNLVMNACDALLPTGGLIRISTANVETSEHEGDPTRAFVEITVSDSGSGIPPDVIENIFEPFFSTKQHGEGTGLGLATSQGVIRQLGGWIDCDSKPGHGTEFRIYLPLAESKAIAMESTKQPSSDVVDSSVGLHVLVVDDEDFVRRSAMMLLQSMGHTTSDACNGAEALERLAELEVSGHSLPDVVLLDQTMPKLSAAEMLPRLRKRYPDLPVVLCSGFLPDLDKFSAVAGSRPEGFLQKPYNSEQLDAVFASVLAEPLAATS